MAAMLPFRAGRVRLGGAMGAVTGVSQQVGQQVMGAAQQIMQGAASSMQKPEDLGLGGPPLRRWTVRPRGRWRGSAVGVAGGGGTEPAGLDTSLPPGGGALPPRRHPREERHQSWRAAEPCMHPPQPHPRVPGWGWE